MGFCALYHQTIIFTGKMLFIRYGQRVLWSQKVCQKYSSQQSGEPNFKNFPLSDQYGSTLQDTDLANSKETQIMRKNSCKQKYLDKNLDVWFLRHGVWQTEFFVIKTPFSPLTPLITQKIKILKKWKKHGDNIILHMCTINENHIWCVVPEIWSVTERIFCHFAPFCTLLPN